MAGLLAEFLRRSAGEPFVWGERDCCLWAAEWIKQLTGRDVASEWRGCYRSRIGCHRLLKREGGLLTLISAIAEQNGFAPTELPQPGDVVLVMFDHAEMLGVKTARGVALKCEPHGIMVCDLKPLNAWRITV